MKEKSNFINLNKFIKKSTLYQESLPFPHCVVDDLWNEEILQKAEKEINNFSNWDGEKEFFGAIGKRFCNNPKKLPRNIKKIIEVLNSPEFLKTLEIITGEKGLIPDPYLEGGGIHSTTNKGFLKMHTDFNWNENLKLYRRLNFILFLNSNWKKEWGGELKLGLLERNKIKVSTEIVPCFNRSVLFNTTQYSYHGHPESLRVPESISRNSIAVYYYVSKKPKEMTFFKRSGTVYRKIDDGRKFNGELILKNFPRKVKTFFKLIFNKICKLIIKVK